MPFEQTVAVRRKADQVMAAMRGGKSRAVAWAMGIQKKAGERPREGRRRASESKSVMPMQWFGQENRESGGMTRRRLTRSFGSREAYEWPKGLALGLNSHAWTNICILHQDFLRPNRAVWEVMVLSRVQVGVENDLDVHITLRMPVSGLAYPCHPSCQDSLSCA